MPARDLYHDIVKTALQKEGWTITHDPYRLKLTRGKNLVLRFVVCDGQGYNG